MKHDDCKYMSTNGRETEEWKCKMLGFCQHINIWGIVAHEFCDLWCMYYEEKKHDNLPQTHHLPDTEQLDSTEVRRADKSKR